MASICYLQAYNKWPVTVVFCLMTIGFKGDLHMAEGVKNVNVIFSIGFLNKKIEENLPMYKV